MAATFYTEQGLQLSLSIEIGRGGEGAIFASPRNELECAKIYLSSVTEETRKKLSIMVERPPVDPTYHTLKHRSISWPSTLLYHDSARRNCAGFFMPKIDLKAFQKALAYIEPTDRSKKFGGGFTWRHLYTAASNIASAVAAVHDQGYCVGDLNESNVLIAPTNALAVLIDCDSFQVPDSSSQRTYRCTVGKAEYTAPELLGKRYEDFDRTVASDAFALAVLLFQLLMEGTHPYQAKGRLVDDAPNTEAKIARGHFAYVMRGREIAPPDHAPPYEVLHPEMRAYFERCFVAGHRAPNARPNAREWHELFFKLKGQFVVCSENNNHCFLNHLRSCPWCGMKKARGRDPFLSPVGHQIALESSSGKLDSLENRIVHLKPYVEMAFADGVLTVEEENYLMARGAELQIPAKEVQKIIEAEARRVQGTKAVTPGTPRIEVSRTNFAFEKVRRGDQVAGSYVISNVGGGSLQGKVRSRQPWVKVSQGMIDPTRHRQEHVFTVDASGLTLGSNNSGSIDIESSGGNVQLQVSVSIEIEKEAISRFRQSMFWLGMTLGGVFGFAVYTLLPDTPSRVVVSALTGLLALVGAIVAASRSGGFIAGCGTFLVGGGILGALQTQLPLVFSVIAWGLTFGSLLHTFSRPLFVSKHAGKAGAWVGVFVTASLLSASVIFGGISLKNGLPLSGRGLPQNPPVEMGTVATCKKATGWKRFTPKSQFRIDEPICIYAEALNVNRGGQIDLTYTVNLKSESGAILTSVSDRFTARRKDPSAWHPWTALKLPANSLPGNYVAEVRVHNNLSNQTGVSSSTFTVAGLPETVPSTPNSASDPNAAATLTGSWTGLWYPTQKTCASPPYPSQQIRLELQQAGIQLTGTFSGPGITTGSLSGTFNGSDIAASLNYGGGPQDGSLQGSLSANQMRGAISEQPRENRCTWSGNFEITRLSPPVDTGLPATRTVSVNSTQPWTSTGIVVRHGQAITFKASGSVHDCITNRCGDKRFNRWVGPEGFTELPHVPGPAPEFPAVSLIGRIANSRAFYVARGTTIVADADGELFLGVNDWIGQFWDNSGAFTVEVSLGK